jgi:PelA/Pel-15E family pectate lyase
MRLPPFLLLLLTPAFLAGGVEWGDVLSQPAEWYAGDEARGIAAAVLQYQTPEGGWTKNTDMTAPPSAEYLARKASALAPTIDNGATTTQLQYLARVVTATGDAGFREAFERGFDYLLTAQYENGGWPQFYPLKPGYYSHITYNDNAMSNVLTLLRRAARASPPYAFLDADRRARAARAVERGIDCILRTQVKQDGRLTAWCAQHDEHTFEPAWARNFEPPSLSGMESAGLVRFLMGEEQPTPAIVAAIEAAVTWLEQVKVHGLRVETTTGPDGKRERVAVVDPSAPPLWARFYELGTNRPIFLGRDRVFHYDYNEIERERRVSYGYLGDWPANLLSREYPRWRKKHNLP